MWKLESYQDVKNVCPNLVAGDFLEFMELSLEECAWKNIASIGGGFWMLEIELAKNWWNVVDIDPIFQDKELMHTKINENIDWFINKLDIASKLYKILYDNRSDSNEWRNNKKEMAKLYQSKQNKILNHLKEWENNQIQYGLSLNASVGDKIEWIDDGSQDIVMINHTLNHIVSNVENRPIIVKDMLNEALRIMKSGWKFWIVDYVGKIWWLDKLEVRLNEAEKSWGKVIRWSFSSGFTKRWLEKFIKDYFN